MIQQNLQLTNEVSNNMTEDMSGPSYRQHDGSPTNINAKYISTSHRSLSIVVYESCSPLHNGSPTFPKLVA